MSERERRRSCRDCRYWYAATKVNQCDIPNPGLLPQGFAAAIKTSDSFNPDTFARAVGVPYGEVIDPAGQEFILSRQRWVHFTSLGKTIYGVPSKLNFDGKCHFYRRRFWSPMVWIRWILGRAA